MTLLAPKTPNSPLSADLRLRHWQIYRPAIRTCDDETWARAQAAEAEDDLQAFRVDGFAGWVICSQRYKVHADPRPHEGSDARYFIDGHIGARHVLFLYWLQGLTSEHVHTDHRIQGEGYYLLAGEATVAGCPLEGYKYTAPGEDHRVASETGALVVAVLYGAANVPRSDWHQYLAA